LEDDGSGFEDVFTRFPARVRASVKAALVRGMLSSERVAEITADLGYGVEQLMIALLPVAAAHANMPTSNYAVGAVALGMAPTGGFGNLYLGANFEFASQVLCFTIHAEQSATNNAWLHGEQGISTLAVSAAPCGSCRQFLNELTTDKVLKIVTSKNGCPDYSHEAQSLSRLLPDAFGPRDLAVKGGLMVSRITSLSSIPQTPLSWPPLRRAITVMHPILRSTLVLPCAVRTAQSIRGVMPRTPPTIPAY